MEMISCPGERFVGRVVGEDFEEGFCFSFAGLSVSCFNYV